jgi:hypothetical protein
MTNTNTQKTIIRLSFARGSNNIRVGLTQLNNLTIVGEIVFHSKLTVSYYNTFVDIDSNNVLGAVGTLVFPNNKDGEVLINSINEIQKTRPTNIRGNKYPFAFLTINHNDLIIFNRRNNENEKDRLSFVNVDTSCVKVDGNAPKEVTDLINNVVFAPLVREVPTTINNYGTMDYYSSRATPLTVKAGKASLNGVKA